MAKPAQPTRRRIVSGLGIAVSTLAMPSIVRAQARRIVVRDLGIGTSFNDAYGREFTRATGIEVQPITGANDPIGQIKQMVDSKTYTWDMSIVARQVANQLTADGQGYLEPLRLESEPSWQALPETFRSPVYAGNDVVATVLGYRTDRAKTAPKSWSDFLDVARFPGRRAMRRSPVDSVEQALLADGVAPEKLYPLDFDRAFRKLDAVKKGVSAWWTSGAQSTQLLQSGEVDFCPSWNGRIQAAINAGAPVAIMWEQALWQSEGWVILKGGPKADLCREFIKFALAPERQAIFAKATGYGPTVPAALNKIEPEVARTMPTFPANRTSAILVDVDFWTRTRDQATERFTKWVVG
jgi:putative spermidine/putrescine transport system substrate-binding protein